MFSERHETPSQKSRAAVLKDYIAIARLDHSTKHVFIVPGIILAFLLRGVRTEHLGQSLILGFLTAVCIASANYVINEFLDRDFDRHHPTKSQRAAVQRQMNGGIVAAEWALFVSVGLTCAIMSSKLLFATACLFALQGIVYNVYPLRSKDKAYVDVISESINNPIRLIIGWSIIDPTSLPPSSLILSYWFGGAFLMAAKRLSEYREIVAAYGVDLLARYRASFSSYSEVSLTSSCITYSLCSVVFLSVFIVKYRIEYILAMPFVVALFTVYFSMSTLAGSSAQKPETLFRETRLIMIVVALVAVFTLASFVDMPVLAGLASQHFIVLK
ncbi:UbiA family prenyltransferase [Pleomorphomonas sp. PLEO]|uniref:UbiA family prenyltransferase n=1 Tax=Pleomorphomonas sp. PLEO TaxID=3239306 RepID=UPI00351E6D84